MDKRGKKSEEESALEMDTSAGRIKVPAAKGRLHGADPSGLDEKGWATTPDDKVGDPDDTNIAPELHEPGPHRHNPARGE